MKRPTKHPTQSIERMASRAAKAGDYDQAIELLRAALLVLQAQDPERAMLVLGEHVRLEVTPGGRG